MKGGVGTEGRVENSDTEREREGERREEAGGGRERDTKKETQAAQEPCHTPSSSTPLSQAHPLDRPQIIFPSVNVFTPSCCLPSWHSALGEGRGGERIHSWAGS